jgi:hypothetical protein
MEHKTEYRTQFNNHFMLRGCAIYLCFALLAFHFSPFTASAADNPLAKCGMKRVYFKPITAG